MRLRAAVIVFLLVAFLGLSGRFLGLDLQALWNWKIAETPNLTAPASEELEVVAKLDEVDFTKPIEDGGFQLAESFTGTIQNTNSLEELREAIDERAGWRTRRKPTSARWNSWSSWTRRRKSRSSFRGYSGLSLFGVATSRTAWAGTNPCPIDSRYP